MELEDLATGAVRRVACDTVVFTADWVPDGELARSLGLVMDPGSGGPLVDAALRTSRDGVFAAGNLVHPVDTADVAALDGRHVARQVLAWLRGQRAAAGGEWAAACEVRLIAGAPFRWIAPGLLRRGEVAPPRGRLLLWSERLVRFPELSVWQGGTEIARRRVPWPAAPGRVFRMPVSVLGNVDFSAGDVTVGLHGKAPGAAGAPSAEGPPGAGPAGSSAGPAGSSAGPAGPSAGPAGSSAGPAGSSAGPAGSSAGPAGSSGGPAGPSAGPAASSAGSTGSSAGPAGSSAGSAA